MVQEVSKPQENARVEMKNTTIIMNAIKSMVTNMKTPWNSENTELHQLSEEETPRRQKKVENYMKLN